MAMSSAAPAQSKFRRLALGMVAVAALATAGCGSFGGGTSAVDSRLAAMSAEELYNGGVAALAAGDFASAAAMFEAVDRQYPYSAAAREALILAAQANYSRSNFGDAIADAQRYITLFPAADRVDYALYVIADSNFQQRPDITRDQEPTERALRAFTDLVQRYPNSQYADEAASRIELARDQLAGKEMDTGRYYLQQRNFIGAINRFRVVVTDYQTTRHVEEALLRLTEAYLSLGVVSEAQAAAAVLGYNFPDSPWYHDAYELLQRQGLSPQSNAGSWISQLFGLG